MLKKEQDNGLAWPPPLMTKSSSPCSSPKSNSSGSIKSSLVFSPSYRSRRLSGNLANKFGSTESLDKMTFSAPNSPSNTNTRETISAHAFPYVENNTSNASMPAYIAKFPTSFYDNAYTLSKKFGNMPLSYLTQKKAEERSQRRYSLLKLDGTPFATGKWPPIKSKTNHINTMAAGHIPFDSFLQATPVNPLDNSIPGSLPLELQNTPPDPELTAFYKKNMSPDIESVWLFTDANLLCVAKWLPEFREIGDRIYEPTGKMCSNPKIGIQEAERLYSILHKMQEGPNKIYEFMYASDDELFFFGPGGYTYRVDLTNLIVDSKQLLSYQEKFTTLDSFEKYIREAHLEQVHAPIFRFNDSGEYEPVLVWCGPNGPVTGDADPNQIPTPFNMTRIASWGIFNGIESPPEKFLNGLKLLLARLKSETSEQFVRYLDTCEFDLEEYLPKEELEYIRNHGNTYINYINPKFTDYNVYQEYIKATKTALAKYEQDPSLLRLVCETDLHSIVIQQAMQDPLSYHAGEDLNPYAGEIGVVLIADQTDDHAFLITENAASYLAYLFSDGKILANWKFAVNSFWLNNSSTNQTLREQWLDVIEVQALNHAKISKFEFKMYCKTIIKILDRRRPGDTIIRPQDEIAINLVNERLSEVTMRIADNNLINNRIQQIYSQYYEQTAKFNMAVADSNEIKGLNLGMQKLNLE